MLTHHFTTTHSPSTLTALIATHRPDWQVCFLNNNHRPVIGICPKTAWHIEFDSTFTAHRYDRHTGQSFAYATTYSDWQKELIAYGKNLDCPSQKDEYTHGLMGFIGYDISAHELNPTIGIKKNQPCAYLGHYDVYLKKSDAGFELFGIDVGELFFNEIKNDLADLLKETLTQPQLAQFNPTWQKQDYTQAFNQTQEYIKAGDTYQINLTQKWQADLANLSSHLPNLQHHMNAPFAGYLQLTNFELLSVSPELFFEFYGENGDIHLVTKPIKGTRPRHANPTIDDDLKNELKNSEKDISENLMIVDLLRNDLGKYAKVSTVKTPKRFAIESFKNVHHMVSTITAQLNNNHSLTVLFGSLPAGSITGTPKKRACEIIHELEIAPRGAYCGTMGYMNFDGTGIWNVLIRTAQKSDKTELWAGGGVTIKSNLDSEYQECTDKVGAILAVFESASI
ncbi:anthranilate synthase component I family protein [Moraxella nasibovis]|uniref:anthranilate synthase component I family protein n=1 Tax=Moraxella nasibovis TaxID=2904120 RepID=UPI00240EF3A7|nr:anthranilate synthase component I family protein [Moraxella nasibovis]WFF38449.1 anthranilate synthase component I family protein [Moraxella nasibovis]